MFYISKIRMISVAREFATGPNPMVNRKKFMHSLQLHHKYPVVFVVTTIFGFACLFATGCKYESNVAVNNTTNNAAKQTPQTPEQADATQLAARVPDSNQTIIQDESDEVKPDRVQVEFPEGADSPDSEPADEPDYNASIFPEDEIPGQEKQTIEISDNWKRLGKEHEIWIDMANKQVMAAGHICLRHGPLEVLICPRRTKEHESVVSLNATALQVHTALVALGADPGHPVRWPFGDEQLEYEPATGPVIKINVRWRQGDEIIERRGQELVREFNTQKPLEQDWVFGGSEFYEDPHTKLKFYYGDSGELVCLSNFSTATMDLPIESTSSNDGLMYECNPDVIPELGTKVYVIFEPVIEKKTAPKNASNPSADSEGQASGDPASDQTGKQETEVDKNENVSDKESDKSNREENESDNDGN